MANYSVVEICAGAGGQSLGLHKAGFEHALAIEIDEHAAETLRANLGVNVAVGDVADPDVWSPGDFVGVDLFAGGVPCPPFSVAGKQLGTSDERDLFAWAIERVADIQPRAVLLENVRGLSSARFSAYRQRVLDRLAELGYAAGWRLVHAADYGVPQLRPRFVLVAVQSEFAPYFRWPEPDVSARVTVGQALRDLMAAGGWPHAEDWARRADEIAPTLVGGSKKHGGADLGPTRAKEAWKRLFVDGRGVADAPPGPDTPPSTEVMPRLTVEMAARIQGWVHDDAWEFSGRKTSQYRQVGNAFPPPVAAALGESIANALSKKGTVTEGDLGTDLHDPVYRTLATASGPVSLSEILNAYHEHDRADVEARLAAIGRDFELEKINTADGVHYRLGEFRGFTGQAGHQRHAFYETQRARVS